MSTPYPQLHQGRDGVTQAIKLINQLRLYAYFPPGTSVCIAGEDIDAFKAVSRDPSTGVVVLARADGTNYAVGVLETAVTAGELALVVTDGIILGAVSGRVANDAVWVGPDGTLVFAAPGVGNYVQPIAACVNATDIFVSVSVPVI